MDFTVSAIREFRTCQRRYEHKYKDLVRPALDGKARLFGSSAHSGFDAHWLKSDAPIDFTNAFWATEAGLVERARCEAVVQAYNERWSPTRGEWGAIEAERVFSFKLGRFTVRGKLDKLAWREGVLCLVEHKTTSDDIATLGDDYWQRIALDLQIAIYQEAIEDEFGERPSVLYDVVKKPQGKPNIKDRKTKERESLDEFRARMVAVMLEAPDEYLVRRVVHRTRDQQRGLIEEALETMAEMEAKRSYARNDTACVSAYGSCAYLGVCSGTEQLDSPRFVKLANAHPELGEKEPEEEMRHGSSDLSINCPV